jgi:N-acyl-D-aspartate/D-glutamate deacylase
MTRRSPSASEGGAVSNLGFAGDVVVLDETEVGTSPVEARMDLHANCMRLYARSRGIEYVLVNGEVIVERGELTGARPGDVLRSGRDTETVSAR